MLTDAAIRAARPQDRPYKLADQRSMYLLVTPTGARLWRWRYRYAGKEKLLALGSYPDLSLAEARDAADDARRQLRSGIDPSQEKRRGKVAAAVGADRTFRKVADLWFAKNEPRWAEGHSFRVQRCIERDLASLGRTPITDVTAADVLAALHRVEARGAVETARRARGVAEQVFGYAIAAGLLAVNPARDLAPALQVPKVKHRAALTDEAGFGNLLMALWGYEGTDVVRAALKLAPLLAVRPGELVSMRWRHLQLEGDMPAWRFTVTKTQTDFVVPLAPQVVSILKGMSDLTGDDEFVLRSPRGDRPLSTNAALFALRACGFDKAQASVHGFRASFRSLAAEHLDFDPRVIELQLAHRTGERLGAAYDRAQHLGERRRLMRAWADYCDRLRHAAEERARARRAA